LRESARKPFGRSHVTGAAPDFVDPAIAARRAGAPGQLPPDMQPWMARTIAAIDLFSLWTGRIVCWLILPMIFAMVYEIVARYYFIAPTIWAYDVSRMVYGAHFMLGAAYALSKGVHIRSDFLYRNWSVKTQARTDALLYLVFYFPSLLLLLWVSGDYASTTIVRGERGMDTAWMPYLGPIRSCIPIAILFLIVQGVAELLKCIYAARTGRWPQQ
jgi:TRAP-type mannitol/chloroaromatic compound transport system permease small subunit